MKKLDHINIVKYIGTELTTEMDGFYFSMAINYKGVDIILEYVSGGSLKELLSKFGKLDERIASKYAY